MEFIRKLHALTNFLAIADATDNQICRFITLDSCAEIFPTSCLLAKLEDDGEFTITGVFGFKSDTVEIFRNLSLVKESMISEAVKSNRVHLNGTVNELEIHQKIDISGKLNEDAAHMVILPISEFGVLLLFTTKEPDVDSSLELFLIAICALLALNKHKSASQAVAIISHLQVIAGKLNLTARQNTILDGIRLGHTNATIALDMGYSESLIRQETIDIFKKLGVSGRKALISKFTDEEMLTKK
ncbi:MAG: LuxR C-terminal-related transcriptional regulator [Candidatus Planktophila sp.]|nr:LuxR C-terminal-related transcriptional regulator [Candidatus Planktophila sp.]